MSFFLLSDDVRVVIDPAGPAGPLCGSAHRPQRLAAQRDKTSGSTAATQDDVRFSQVLDLKRSGPEPLYYQLACSVEAAIAAGTITSGTKFPSERDIARELCLATATVRLAWSYLEGRGLIKRGRRTGTFIT